MFKARHLQRTTDNSTQLIDIEIPEDPKHWSHNILETSLSLHSQTDSPLVGGGAEHGELCWFANLQNDVENLSYHGCARLSTGDIFLEVENQPVVGFTSYDLARWLSITSKNNNIISIKFLPNAYLTKDLRKFLNTRFQRHSVDHDLQHTIRLNIYRRTVPCTTRPMRDGEIDGVDYKFLTKDEFQLIHQEGGFLESGTYSGNSYGTPLPPRHEDIVVEIDDPHSQPKYIDLHNINGYQENTSTNLDLDSVLANLKLLSGANSKGDEDDDALPPGWEKVDSYPEYGIFYVDHINKRTQFEPPQAERTRKKLRARSSDDLIGEFMTTCLVKGPNGLGFTIIGGDETSDLLQVKTIIPGGPAHLDQKLQKGDVLVSVDKHKVLGSSHKEIIHIFQAMSVGSLVPITFCRGYPLSFDPDDPNHKIIRTMAVQPPSLLTKVDQPPKERRTAIGLSPSKQFVSWDAKKTSLDASQSSAISTDFRNTSKDRISMPNGLKKVKVNLVRGPDGFRFTLNDLVVNDGGQRVRSILDRSRCSDLREGDMLEKINNITVSKMTHMQVVEILKACPIGKETEFVVVREVPMPIRSYSVTPSMERSHEVVLDSDTALYSRIIKPNWKNNRYISHHGTPWKINLISDQTQGHSKGIGRTPGPVRMSTPNITEEQTDFHNKCISPHECNIQSKPPETTTDFLPAYHFSDLKLYENQKIPSVLTSADDKVQYYQPSHGFMCSSAHPELDQGGVISVRLFRNAEGFGFKLGDFIGEESFFSKNGVVITYVLPGGAADLDGRVKIGDEIIVIDSVSTLGISVWKAKEILAEAYAHGVVNLVLKRKISPVADLDRNHKKQFSPQISSVPNDIQYQKSDIFQSCSLPLTSDCHEVRLTKSDQQSFGFTIISTSAKTGSKICSIVPSGPAAQCGQLNVDDQLLAINGLDVHNMAHEDIVALIRGSGNVVNLLVATPPFSNGHSPMATDNNISSKEHNIPYLFQGPSCYRPESSQLESIEGLTSSNHSKTSKFHYLEIPKSSNGFGFTISGGREYGDVPLSILKIARNGPAAQNGILEVGDQLVEINGQNTSGMTHAEAIKAVQSNPLKVMLLIKRNI